MKANPHPSILQTVISSGLGIDVSSGYEMGIALQNNAKRILFTGPGKTEDELTFAIELKDRVIVHIDSFSELQKIGNFAQKQKK